MKYVLLALTLVITAMTHDVPTSGITVIPNVSSEENAARELVLSCFKNRWLGVQIWHGTPLPCSLVRLSLELRDLNSVAPDFENDRTDEDVTIGKGEIIDSVRIADPCESVGISGIIYRMDSFGGPPCLDDLPIVTRHPTIPLVEQYEESAHSE